MYILCTYKYFFSAMRTADLRRRGGSILKPGKSRNGIHCRKSRIKICVFQHKILYYYIPVRPVVQSARRTYIIAYTKTRG